MLRGERRDSHADGLSNTKKKLLRRQAEEQRRRLEEDTSITPFRKAEKVKRNRDE